MWCCYLPEFVRRQPSQGRTCYWGAPLLHTSRCCQSGSQHPSIGRDVVHHGWSWKNGSSTPPCPRRCTSAAGSRRVCRRARHAGRSALLVCRRRPSRLVAARAPRRVSQVKSTGGCPSACVSRVKVWTIHLNLPRRVNIHTYANIHTSETFEGTRFSKADPFRPCATFTGASMCTFECDVWVMVRALVRPVHTVIAFGARYGTTTSNFLRIG